MHLLLLLVLLVIFPRYWKLWTASNVPLPNTIAVCILEIATLETLGMVCSFDPFSGARLLVRIICHKFVKVDDIKWTDFKSKFILFCLVRTHFLSTDDEAGITEYLIQELPNVAISTFSYRHQKLSWLSFRLSASFFLETSCLHVSCKFMDCSYAGQYHTAATFHLRIYVFPCLHGLPRF